MFKKKDQCPQCGAEIPKKKNFPLVWFLAGMIFVWGYNFYSDETVKNELKEAEKTDLIMTAKGLLDENKIQEALKLLEKGKKDFDDPKIEELFTNALEKVKFSEVQKIPSSDIDKNLVLYKELQNLNPENKEYSEKVIFYQNQVNLRSEEERKAREEKRRLAEIEKQKFIAQTTKNLRKSVDDLEGITWFYHKNSPLYTSERNSLFLYLGQRGSSPPWVRLKVQYTASDWLFIETYTVYADGQKFVITSGDFERDNSSKIWEWSDTNLNARELQMIRAVIDSKKAVIRFNGSQYSRDWEIPEKDKIALKTILEVYTAMGGQLP